MKQKKKDFESKFLGKVTYDPSLDEQYRGVIINPEKYAQVKESLKGVKLPDTKPRKK